MRVLVGNALLPGFGSLAFGRARVGLVLLAIFFCALPFTLFLIGDLTLAAVWIASLVEGVRQRRRA